MSVDACTVCPSPRGLAATRGDGYGRCCSRRCRVGLLLPAHRSQSPRSIGVCGKWRYAHGNTSQCRHTGSGVQWAEWDTARLQKKRRALRASTGVCLGSSTGSQPPPAHATTDGKDGRAGGRSGGLDALRGLTAASTSTQVETAAVDRIYDMQQTGSFQRTMFHRYGLRGPSVASSGQYWMSGDTAACGKGKSRMLAEGGRAAGQNACSGCRAVSEHRGCFFPLSGPGLWTAIRLGGNRRRLKDQRRLEGNRQRESTAVVWTEQTERSPCMLGRGAAGPRCHKGAVRCRAGR